MKEEKLNALEIIAKLFRGDLPTDLEVKTQFIAALLDFEHSISSGHALLITVARRDNFKDDKVWASWCEDKFGFTASHRCHMGQAGRLLMDVVKKIDLFQFLFKLELQKLISLERIDRLDLPGFLDANDVAALNRDQVRDAVNNFLGQVEPTKSFPVNPAKAHQPDLFDLVDNICTLRSETLYQSIDNNDKAFKFVKSGMGLFGAGLEYCKSHPEAMKPEMFEKIKAVLEGEIKTLTAIQSGFKVSKVS
jgi:hypothetical protein